MFTAYLAINITRRSLEEIKSHLDSESWMMWEYELENLLPSDTTDQVYSFVFHIAKDSGQFVDAILPNQIIEAKYHTAQTSSAHVRWITPKK